jgi:hypothetical protein
MERKDPVAELYAKPIEQFTASRKQLAQALEFRGERALAARVRAAPKPTRAAWVLDRIAREAYEPLKALYAAGDRMRRSQHRSAREAATHLRQATAERARALHALEIAAQRMLETRRYAATPALLRTITDVLRRASVDHSMRTQLAQGTLARVPSGEEAMPFFVEPVKQPRSHDATPQFRPVSPVPRSSVREPLAHKTPRRRDAKRSVGVRSRDDGQSSPTPAQRKALREATARVHRAHESLDRAVAQLRDAEGKVREAEATVRETEARQATLQRAMP